MVQSLWQSTRQELLDLARNIRRNNTHQTSVDDGVEVAEGAVEHSEEGCVGDHVEYVE